MGAKKRFCVFCFRERKMKLDLEWNKKMSIEQCCLFLDTQFNEFTLFEFLLVSFDLLEFEQKIPYNCRYSSKIHCVFRDVFFRRSQLDMM